MDASQILIHKGQEFKSNLFFGPPKETKPVYNIVTSHFGNGYFDERLNKEPFTTEELAQEALKELESISWLDVSVSIEQLRVFELGPNDYYLAKEDYHVFDFLSQLKSSKLTYIKEEQANIFLSQFNLTLKEVLNVLS